jgi:hypothetical protein
MAGFREFVTGEVLTAANVDDFLAKQAVMKFADAAARDAALGTAVVSPNALREGMVAYLDSTDEVIKYDGTSWATVGNPGIGSNTQTTIKTDVFSASPAGGAVTDITGLSVTITPTSASSKVLVLFDVSGNVATVHPASFILKRDGTPVGVGDAEGARTQTTTGGYLGDNDSTLYNVSAAFLDSPGTTDPVVYQIAFLNGRGSSTTFYINRGVLDTSATAIARSASRVTAIEVKS